MLNKELIKILQKLPENNEVLINLFSSEYRTNITDDVEAVILENNKIILSDNIIKK